MRPRSAKAPSILWLVLLGAVLALFGAHAGRYWDFTPDDAGISFSYARNLAAGYGLVLSPGAERVEAVTNLLWCLLLAPARWTPLGFELWSKILGLFSGCTALACIALFPATAYNRRPGYYDLVAPLIAACMPLFPLWCVSGLENGLFAALAAGALLAVAREEGEPGRFPWSAVILPLLFATRPDGLLYAAGIGAAKLLRRLSPRPQRRDLLWLSLLALGVGALELFRLSYFAWPLPNSFYAKRRTFEFGRNLFDTRGAGWAYLGGFLLEYKLVRAAYALPLILLGVGGTVARLALLGCCAAALFLPIYSHGDWMEEYRFISFAVPILALGIAEGVRAPARLVQVILPASTRKAFAVLATPVLAFLVVTECTRYYPERIEQDTHHSTTAFHAVEGRARYFAAAARVFDLDGRPGLLDPDVGGTSFDGRLTIVDLFGLGDIPIAHTHPNDPPGSREAVFWERRPEFVHMHGAWYAAMEFPRLEEITEGYLPMPARLPDGSTDPDSNWVRRESIAAPWYGTGSTGMPPGGRATGGFIDGYTVSHRGVEPGHRIAVEVTVANANAADPGAVVLLSDAGRSVEENLVVAGGALPGAAFHPGERPRARVYFSPRVPGRYRLLWRSPAGQLAHLGALTVRAGAGAADMAQTLVAMDADLAAGRMASAYAMARALWLRTVADPSDDGARDGLSRFGRVLADRASALAAGGAYVTAALVAREARRWAPFDSRTVSATQSVAERLADAARADERAGNVPRAFILAREAVLTDPRRSWSRRRAEELRARRPAEYDGGRDQAAYRMSAALLAGAADADATLIYLASVNRWRELAGLAERLPREPQDPRARVALARGLASRGETNEALALVSGVPCAAAHDPELSRALRALTGHAYRPGDAACEAEPPAPRAPFDDAEGSFESGTFGGWTAVGDAFGRGPTASPVGIQQYVNGYRGRFYANSFARGTEQATGTLRSRAFVVDAEAMSFVVAGGADPAQVGVRLLIDGHVVLVAAGQNHEGMRRVFWDLRPYRGRTARVEIYDLSGGPWAHVTADDFRLEPLMPVLPPPAAPPPVAAPPAPAPAPPPAAPAAPRG